MLTEKAQDLIEKAQIVSFDTWKHPVESIEIFQAANKDRVYLTDEDCERISMLSPRTSTLMPIAKLLRDRVVDIVDEARSDVLTKFPTITEPGGGLYPAIRAEACWRDFWHYLRPITYAIAAGESKYTSAEGLKYMHLLYQELEVPLDAMAVGLDGLRLASLSRIEASQQFSPGEAAPTIVAGYFDDLIVSLKSFV
jgi:Phycobilisome protein